MANQSKEKAIIILKTLEDELSTVRNLHTGNTWKARVREALIHYVGPKSQFIIRLDQLHFTKKVETTGGHWGTEAKHIYTGENKEWFCTLIQNVISHITDHGLYKKEVSGNFLAGFTNTQVIAGIITSLGLIVPACVFIGNLQKDREMAGIERQLDDRNRKIEQLETDKEQQSATIQTLNKLLVEQGKAMIRR